MTKRVLAIGAAVALAILLSGCAPKAASSTVIRYAGQYYPEEFVLKGDAEIWGRHGVKVEHVLYSSGTENNQALVSGATDINVGADSRTVALFAAIPEEALIIACSQRGDRYSTIIRNDSPYASWQDLKGKQVGTRMGTGAEQVLRRYLEKNGFRWEDFQWVNLKIEDMAAALTAKRIEAFTAWEPTPAIAEATGAGKVMMSYGDVALVPVFIHTTRSFAEKHRKEIVKFLAAHLEKVEMIQKRPEEAATKAAAAASAQGAAVSADVFTRVFRRVDFSLDVNQTVIDALKDTAQFSMNLGEIKSIPEFHWDSSYLEEARKLFARRKS